MYQWEKHDIIHQPPAPVVEEGKPIPPVVIKSLYRLVSEHKDVVKVVIVLNSIISSFKMDAKQVLSGMAQFEELWNQVCYQETLGKPRQMFLPTKCFIVLWR